MTVADYLRVIAVVETVICCGGFVGPLVAATRVHTWRVWLLVFSVEGFMFSCAMAVIAHFGDSGVAWYRTPATVAFGAVGIVYLAIYRRDTERGKALARKLNDRSR